MFLDKLVPTQRINIPKTTESLELELQNLFKERIRYNPYKEIVSNKIFIDYNPKVFSFFKKNHSHRVELTGYNDNINWILKIHIPSENIPIIKYFYLIFPVICVIMFFVFGHPKTILIGFLAGSIHVILNNILMAIDLYKWKKVIQS